MRQSQNLQHRWVMHMCEAHGAEEQGLIFPREAATMRTKTSCSCPWSSWQLTDEARFSSSLSEAWYAGGEHP